LSQNRELNTGAGVPDAVYRENFGINARAALLSLIERSAGAESSNEVWTLCSTVPGLPSPSSLTLATGQ